MPVHEPSGAERAAAFLLTLGSDQAAEVIKHLDEGVILDVVEAMGALDRNRIDPEGVELLQKELLRALGQPSGTRVRSEDELLRMLEQTLGAEQAAKVFDKLQQHLIQERPFLSIEREPPGSIATALEEESDAVAALVIAHIDPSLSAEILAAFDAERSLAVVKRMATLVPPSFETLIAIAADLAERLRTIAATPMAAGSSARLKTIAEVLNLTAPEVEKTVLDGIDAEDSEMAAEIREFMFTWDDLARVDRRVMQKILASVDTRTLSISLKGSSEAVVENIMSNLSPRVCEMVNDEREAAGAMSMKEVQFSRDEVLHAVRGLMEAGEFRPSSRTGDELVT